MPKRDTRLRFEQWTRNPDCEANTLSAILGIAMAEVARAEGITATIGQSPFALQRGIQFERYLLAREGIVLRDELARAGIISDASSPLIDLRLRRIGGGCGNLDEARERTLSFLRNCATSDSMVPSTYVLAGATISIPGRAMLPEAIVVLDVLVVTRHERHFQLTVGEIKTYPDRGGYTDRRQLASSRAQAGLYVYGLNEVIRAEAWSDQIRVSRIGFLILTRPGTNRPSVRAAEDLHFQALRSARSLEQLRQIADQLHDSEVSTKPVDAVLAASTAYQEACVTFCDRAQRCRDEALRTGNPAALGDDVAALTRGLSLSRIRELVQGAPPRDDNERRVRELAREAVQNE